MVDLIFFTRLQDGNDNEFSIYSGWKWYMILKNDKTNFQDGIEFKNLCSNSLSRWENYTNKCSEMLWLVVIDIAYSQRYHLSLIFPTAVFLKNCKNPLNMSEACEVDTPWNEWLVIENIARSFIHSIPDIRSPDRSRTVKNFIRFCRL